MKSKIASALLGVLIVSGPSFAAQQTFSNGEAMSSVRTKINANDTELYAQAATKWVASKAYTANNTSVTHGGHVFICISSHTSSAAGATGDEPGVGDTWATKWKYAGEAASAIAFTPDGSIEATTVQTAIEEVRDEAQPLLGSAGSASFWLIQESVLGVQSIGVPGTWKMFYTDGAGGVESFDIGTTGYVLTSNGTGGAPSWTAAGAGDMVLATAQSVTGAKTFDPSMLLMKGTSTGVTTFATANTSASNYTVTFPATTGTVALTSQLFDPAAPGAIGGTTPAAATFTTVTAATYATSAADGSRKSELPNNTSATPTGGGVEEIYNEGGAIKVVEADTEYDLLHSGDVDSTPDNGDTGTPVSEDWAYDHAAAADPHTGYLKESSLGTGVETALGNSVDASGGVVTYDADLADLADGSLTASKVSGAAVVTASKSTTYTIGTDSANESYGGTVYVTSATTITAPAVATGMNFTVVTIGDIAVSLDVNASDKMILDGVTLADGDKATNSSKAGDTITCQYYSADGFYCWSGTVLGGHWTDGN